MAKKRAFWVWTLFGAMMLVIAGFSSVLHLWFGTPIQNIEYTEPPEFITERFTEPESVVESKSEESEASEIPSTVSESIDRDALRKLAYRVVIEEAPTEPLVAFLTHKDKATRMAAVDAFIRAARTRPDNYDPNEPISFENDKAFWARVEPHLDAA